MKNYNIEPLITEEDIEKRVKELSEKITKDYKGKDLVLVGILKGAFMFITDLAKNIDLPISIDFMSVSSYGNSTESSGVVRVIKDLDQSIEGKDILIVEDIVDTGLTLKYLLENLKGKKANSVKTCTLLDKPYRRKVDVLIDYKGFDVEDLFVVGYGIDYAQKHRNLPYVGCVREI